MMITLACAGTLGWGDAGMRRLVRWQTRARGGVCAPARTIERTIYPGCAIIWAVQRPNSPCPSQTNLTIWYKKEIAMEIFEGSVQTRAARRHCRASAEFIRTNV